MVLDLGRYLDVQGKYPVATVADITHHIGSTGIYLQA